MSYQPLQGYYGGNMWTHHTVLLCNLTQGYAL